MLMMAKKGDIVRSYFKSYSGMNGYDVLDSLEADIKNVAGNTVKLLMAEKITPGRYECICTPEVTGMIAHEAFGHGVEMDMFVKDRALAKSFIGKEVASGLVTMHDGKSSPQCDLRISTWSTLFLPIQSFNGTSKLSM